MKKTQGVHQPDSAKIGFHAWDLAASDKFKEMFNETLAEILAEGFKIATEEYQCHAWFPIEWAGGENPEDGVGGPPPTDPTTIYVEIPIGPDEDDNPRWTFKLSELVDSLIDVAETMRAGGPIGDEQRGTLAAVRDDLIRLAARLDDALNRPKQ